MVIYKFEVRIVEVVKNLKKELKNKNDNYEDIETINIKAESKAAIFSDYNYDSNEVLNSNLEEFLIEKVKNIPPKVNLRVKIFTDHCVDENEVKVAYKNKFKGDFEELEQELKRNMLFAFTMLILGVLFMGFLILEIYFLNNYILSTILEIAVWVFVWEAVDSFFLERSSIRRKRYQLARLYYADLEVVTLDFDKIEKNLTKID